jgi:hypothetical protein
MYYYPMAVVFLQVIDKKDATAPHAMCTNLHSDREHIQHLTLCPHSPHCACSGQLVLKVPVSLRLLCTIANTLLGLSLIWILALVFPQYNSAIPVTKPYTEYTLAYF